MTFGSVPVGEAAGAILAHALELPDGRLKKGHLITAEDVARMREAAVSDVIVARLSASDAGEDAVAEVLADQLALADGHIEAAAPFTGRSNLHATERGILRIDREVVHALNAIDPSLTLATLADGTFVDAGRMVATVKVIPFAVPRAAVEAAQEVLANRAVMQVRPANALKVALIATRLEALKESVMDKTARELTKRLEALGSTLEGEARVAHDVSALRDAVRAAIGGCDLLVIFGASAITDARDVIPSAIEAAGGRVERFGMPVDPGNLLLVGEIDGKPVIGAPGCARSPAENGFDWVLQRLVCGLPVTHEWIAGLGVGGLLMEINSRPQPREG